MLGIEVTSALLAPRPAGCNSALYACMLIRSKRKNVSPRRIARKQPEHQRRLTWLGQIDMLAAETQFAVTCGPARCLRHERVFMWQHVRRVTDVPGRGELFCTWHSSQMLGNPAHLRLPLLAWQP